MKSKLSSDRRTKLKFLVGDEHLDMHLFLKSCKFVATSVAMDVYIFEYDYSIKDNEVEKIENKLADGG